MKVFKISLIALALCTIIFILTLYPTAKAEYKSIHEARNAARNENIEKLKLKALQDLAKPVTGLGSKSYEELQTRVKVLENQMKILTRFHSNQRGFKVWFRKQEKLKAIQANKRHRAFR